MRGCDVVSGLFRLRRRRRIWNTSNQFVFVSTPLQRDGSIVARVRDLQNTDPWAKAGLMRESLEPGARHASIFVTPGQGVAFQRRTLA